MSKATRDSVTRHTPEPRLDGLTPVAIEQLHKAARALRDGVEPMAR